MTIPRFPRLTTIMIAAALIFLSGCTASNDTAPRAVNGILDLRSYDPAIDSPIELSGEWDFYWNRLIAPDSITQLTNANLRTTVKLPAPWHAYTGNNQSSYPVVGHATYHLRILADTTRIHNLFLVCREQNSAYRLFVNNNLLLSNGTIGTSRQAEKPQFALSFASCPVVTDTLDCVLQISNYHNDNGGALFPIRIGSKEQLLNSFATTFMLQILSLGLILVFLLHYGTAFLMRPKEKGSMHMALFCLCWSLIIICESGDFRLITLLFPHMPFELLGKLYYIALAASLPLATRFCAELFPTRLFRITNPALLILSGLYALIVLFTDTAVYSMIFPYFITIADLFTVTILHALVVGLRKKQPGSIIFSTGFVLFCAAGINDSLYNSSIIQSTFLCTYGAAALIFAQALILFRRHAEMFSANKRLLQSLADIQRETVLLKKEKQQFIAEREAQQASSKRIDEQEIKSRSIGEELTRRDEQIAILEEQFASSVKQIPEALADGTSLVYTYAVNVMTQTVSIYEKATGRTKADFAEESQLWAVHTDLNGWRRTLTLDKYLDIRKIPKLPKWKKINDSAEYVLERHPESDRADALRAAVAQLNKALTSEY